MNKKNDGKLTLIASIAFGIAAAAWFVQAVSSSENIHYILAAANAVLAAVYGLIYVKNRE